MNKVLFVLGLMFALPSHWAFAEGAWSLGVNLGMTAVDQSDMNTLISRANTAAGGLPVSELGNAWEFEGSLAYRFDGSMVELRFLNLSYFFQGEDGTGGNSSLSGNYNYEINGFTYFPMFRFYLLEDEVIRFYTQVGIGLAFVTGTIKEAGAEAKFKGNDMGYKVGLGAEFCVIGKFHCIAVEGNYRYLKIVRVVGTGGSTTSPTGNLTNLGNGNEIEIDDRDLSINLSGIQGFVGYHYYF